MQISRHWRMNAQRYRLEGVRYTDGSVSLQERPEVEADSTNDRYGETSIANTEELLRESSSDAA